MEIRKPKIKPRLKYPFPKWYNEVQRTSTNCNEVHIDKADDV